MASSQDASESEESALNVNVLKELARKNLVDALNSVSVEVWNPEPINVIFIRLMVQKRSSLMRH